MILQVLAFDSGLDRVKLSHLQTSVGLDVPCPPYQNHFFYSIEINTHMLKYNYHKLSTAFVDFQQHFSSNKSKKAKLPANCILLVQNSIFIFNAQKNNIIYTSTHTEN